MSSPAPRLILTRPDPENAAWLGAMQRAGVNAQAWPLIDIRAMPGAAPHLASAWRDMHLCRAVMFVSRPAVQHFFAARPQGMDWPVSTRAWCTGPGTRNALLDQGLTPNQIDLPAQNGLWDTEHLWLQVSGQIHPGDEVLLVRGDEAAATADGAPTNAARTGVGRDWLAQQLTQAHCRIRWAVAYQRACPIWTAEQVNQAMAALQDGSVWVFSSAQGLAHLSELLPAASFHKAKALATHPRIAAKATALGFARVGACRPAVEEVLASLEFMA
jgi:uroporphyrinogen-III synthase